MHTGMCNRKNVKNKSSMVLKRKLKTKLKTVKQKLTNNRAVEKQHREPETTAAIKHNGAERKEITTQ